MNYSLTISGGWWRRGGLSLLSILLWVATVSATIDVPPLSGRVNDLAGILPPDAAARIERELAAFERKESTQIVVLTLPSLDGEPIESFGIRVAEAWQIGQKGKDNGVILIVSVADRKIRIEVGRGLEERLTDLVASLIIRNEISPRFKQGDFTGGILRGVQSIEDAVTGMYKPSRSVRHSARSHAPAPLTFLVGVLIAILIAGSISRILGGIVGGITLPVAASFLVTGLGMVGWALLALLGFVLGLVIPLLFLSGRGGGMFFPGGGGFGGFSGGGFSGGGGGFGGGGASGDW